MNAKPSPEVQTDLKEAATALSKEAPRSTERRKPPYTEAQLKVYDRFLATLTALLTLAGGFGTAFVYLADQRDKQRAEEKLKEQELNLRKAEMAGFLYNDKRDAYYALVDAASAIAGCQNAEQVSEASKQFIQLYFGRAHLVIEGDSDVFDAKIAFMDALRSYLEEKPDTAPRTYFGGLALDITDACRHYLDPRAFDSDEGVTAVPKGPMPLITAKANKRP